MDLQELKNTIAVIERAEANIENWRKLKGREIALIPTDSEYYKKFQDFVKKEKIYYDGENEKAPMYCRADKVIGDLIKAQEHFMKPHKEKISSLLSTSTEADA